MREALKVSVNQGLILIVVMCVIVLIIGSVRNKMELFANFVIRALLGGGAIYFINMVLAANGLNFTVGLNPATIATSGVLGIPGVALLYVIVAYMRW